MHGYKKLFLSNSRRPLTTALIMLINTIRSVMHIYYTTLQQCTKSIEAASPLFGQVSCGLSLVEQLLNMKDATMTAYPGMWVTGVKTLD